MRTSATDRDDYRNIVYEIVNSNALFAQFRDYHSAYNKVLEHTTEALGWKFLGLTDYEKFRDPETIEWARENDTIGNPKIYEYGTHGYFSPTTLMYLKVLSDIDGIFGEIESVVELGGGYGGQARLLIDWYSIEDYKMIDLPEVVRLQDKYLREFDIYNVDFYTHPEAANPQELFLSCFAFDELSPEWQEMVFNHLIKRCPNGYISGRWIDGGEYTPEGIRKKMGLNPGNCLIEPYQPHTGIDCETIYWRK